MTKPRRWIERIPLKVRKRALVDDLFDEYGFEVLARSGTLERRMLDHDFDFGALEHADARIAILARTAEKIWWQTVSDDERRIDIVKRAVESERAFARRLAQLRLMQPRPYFDTKFPWHRYYGPLVCKQPPLYTWDI